MDKFVETQLKICKLDEGLCSRFHDITEEQFRNLTYEDLQRIFPESDNRRLRTRLLVLIEELQDNEVNIVNEVIRVERQAITAKVEVKDEPVDNLDNESQPSFPEESSGGIFAPIGEPLNIKQENLGGDAEVTVKGEISNDVMDIEEGVVVNVKLEPKDVGTGTESSESNNHAPAGSIANRITTTLVRTDRKSTSSHSVGNRIESRGAVQKNSVNSAKVTSSSRRSKTSAAVNGQSVVNGINSSLSTHHTEAGSSRSHSNSRAVTTIANLNNQEEPRTPTTESTPPTPVTPGRKRVRPSQSWLPLSKKAIATASLIPTGDKMIDLKMCTPTKSRFGQHTSLDSLRLSSKRKNPIKTLNFGFTDLSMMDQVLQTCFTAKQLKHLTRLIFSPSSTSEEQQPQLVIMGMTQMILLSQLPQLPNLTKIGLHIGISIELKDSLEVLLATCSALVDVEVERGFIGGPPAGSSQNSTTLRIPTMPRLNSFSWAKNYGVKPTIQEKSTLIELDDDEENETAAVAGPSTSARPSPPPPSSTISTIIDFSNHEYMFFESLELGITAGLKLNHDIGYHFPNLISLSVASFWDPLLVFPAGAAEASSPVFFPKIVELQFPTASTEPRLIEQVLPCLPNLEMLWINNPSVTFLRMLIRSLATHTHVQQLYLITDFDFESALFSAILDLPYIARTQKDVEKVKKIKQYKHWEKFVKHFKIELPGEEEEGQEEGGQVVEGDNGGLSEDERRRGIGLIQSLRTIHWEHEQRTIFMPTGDKLWSDLEFELSKKLICYKEMPFPKDVLDEMKKLRNLESFLFYQIKISDEDWNSFAAVMNFCPVQIEWTSYTSLVECKDSLTKQVSMKREKKS